MTRRAYRAVQAARIAAGFHRWPLTHIEAIGGQMRRQHAWSLHRAGLYRRAGMKRDARHIITNVECWRTSYAWTELPA